MHIQLQSILNGRKFSELLIFRETMFQILCSVTQRKINMGKLYSIIRWVIEKSIPTFLH